MSRSDWIESKVDAKKIVMLAVKKFDIFTTNPSNWLMKTLCQLSKPL